MGGTEIFETLESLFNSPRKLKYSRHVFLLTDGDVTNHKNVI